MLSISDFVAFISILTCLGLSTTLVVRGIQGKHHHRKKRNQRLVDSILKPFSRTLTDREKDPSRPREAPVPIPSYKRFNWKTFLRATGVRLSRREVGLFYQLRQKVWNINEDEYVKCFKQDKLEGGGNLGFSGAAFFFTPNGKRFIVKSLPNEFEWKFFYDDLLVSYFSYMSENRDSLLCRITDALFNLDLRFWNWIRLGTASNFLVMQNNLPDFNEDKGCKSYDLKPQDYLRADLMVPMSSEQEETMLFHKKGIKLSRQNYDNLITVLTRDCKFLSDKKVVDYSLLLGIYPIECVDKLEQPQNFFSGVISSDGKFVYRISIIDYFFSHKTAPTIIANVADVIPGDQEFTFTDKPSSYRQKFLDMVKEYIDVTD
ncbi:phosphatidylinositol 4-phosphate 5-kinase Pip5k1b [Acrasis kona]|uniref:Phosphatidylinositol 4-phosphate 5-kinase Pip5k1b n=1 Tax=Acrasis kona TaxID=1008807 RepID=A0AAW2Z8G4_9EUKA